MPVSSRDRDRDRDSSKPTKVDDLLTNAASALAIANDFGALLPIPLVCTLIGTAQVIIQTAQTVRQSRASCAELASRVGRLAQLVREQVHGRNELVDARLQNALEELNKTFKEIKQFVLQQDRTSLFQRIAHRSAIESEVKKFISELDFSLRLFQTGSHIRAEITLREVAADVHVQATQLLAIGERGYHERKYHDGGQFRCYRQCDVRLLRRLSFYADSRVAEAGSQSVAHYPLCPEYYSAEVEGRASVVVKKRMIVRPNDAVDARGANLVHMKRFFHPNIAQLEGYSDATAGHFYIIKGDLVPLTTFLQAPLSVADRGRQLLNALIGSARGVSHLLGSKLLVDHEKNDLMIDVQTQNIIIGANGQFYYHQCNGCDVGCHSFLDAKTMQHDLAMYFAHGGSLTYTDTITLWSDCAESHTLYPRRQACCYSSMQSVYMHSGIILKSRGCSCCFDLAELVDPSVSPFSINWPPKLYLASHGAASLNPHQPIGPGSQIVSASYDVCPEEYAQMTKHLLERAVTLSKKFDTAMTTLYAVHHLNFTLNAELVESSADNPPVYLHIRPLENGLIQIPWAYYSFDQQPILSPTEEEMMMVSNVIYKLTDRFSSTLPGVTANVWVTVNYDTLSLDDLKAEFVLFLYDNFHPLGAETAKSGGQIVEIVEEIKAV